MSEEIKINFGELAGNASVNVVDYVYLQTLFSRLDLPTDATIVDVETIVEEKGLDNLEDLYKTLISQPK